MSFGFKANPKQKAENKALQLFGRNADVVVRGRRIRDAADATEAVPVGTFFAECLLDGKVVATGQTKGKDWRKAYRLLTLQIESAFDRSLRAPEAV